MGYTYSHSIKNPNNYIPSTGGNVTFELFSEKTFRDAQNNLVKQRAIITRVYSPEKNFVVKALAETIDFTYIVTARFKPVSEVSWDSGQHCKEGLVPVSFEVSDENQTRVFTMYLKYLGNLRDYLDVSSATETAGGAVVNVLSFKEVCNDQTIKLSVTPEIETPDSEHIQIELISQPKVITPLDPFKFNLTFNVPVQEISGITYDTEENVYILPLTIKQKEYTYDTLNPPITEETAQSINYNLILNPV